VWSEDKGTDKSRMVTFPSREPVTYMRPSKAAAGASRGPRSEATVGRELKGSQQIGIESTISQSLTSVTLGESLGRFMECGGD